MLRKTAGLASALMLSTSLGACAQLSGLMPGERGVTAPPSAAVPAATPFEYVRDIHSHARPEIARVVHVDLDLSADFAAKVLSGTATLDVTAEPGATELILDARNLDIRSIKDGQGRALHFMMGEDDPILGQAVRVHFPAFAAGERRRFVVDYATRPDAAALQWLSPSQTAGGRKPYLFSQGQAILTRTWVPTQDSPGIRQTWSARITAPSDL